MARTIGCALGVTIGLVAAPAVASPSRVYIEAGAAIATYPALGDDWSPVAIDLRLGAGLWLRQRVGVFAEVGLAPSLARSAPLVGPPGTIDEHLRFATGAAGLKLNVWPRASWIQVDVLAGARYLIGTHDLLLDGADVARRVASVGYLAGIEVSVIKFKQQSASITARYFRQPTDLGVDTGYRAMGMVDLGGPEVMVEYALLFRGAVMRFAIGFALLAACYQIDTETDLAATSVTWTGAIQRDGVGVKFVGYDPITATTELGGFGAVGWIGPPDAVELAYVDLTFEGVAQLAAMQPTQLMLAQHFLNGQSGVAVSYMESGQPGFRTVYLEDHGETVAGTLAIADTDWSTHLSGTLTATLHDGMGHTRALALEVRWHGTKD